MVADLGVVSECSTQYFSPGGLLVGTDDDDVCVELGRFFEDLLFDEIALPYHYRCIDAVERRRDCPRYLTFLRGGPSLV
ncbi:hypothetical protein ACFQHN_24490 [Natrialbaceae archaeon GCM10025896]